MSDSETNGSAPRRPHPNRVAGMRKVNELLHQRREQGGVWPGGHPPTHGQRMLEGLLKRGDGLPGTLGQLLAEKEAGYLADLGGLENVSNMEAGLVRRLAEGDLFLALVRAQMIAPNGEPKRLPWVRLRDVATLHARLADSYKGLALALGLRRRELDATPREIVVTRYAEPAPAREAPKG